MQSLGKGSVRPAHAVIAAPDENSGIGEVCGASELPGDTDSFMQAGIIDSTGVLELVAFVEDQYDISIEDDEMTPANLDTLDSLVTFISGKLG